MKISTSEAARLVKYITMDTNIIDIKILITYTIDIQENDMDTTKKEVTPIESLIATCKACMLAQAMKQCPICRFNIGLTEPVKPLTI